MNKYSFDYQPCYKCGAVRKFCTCIREELEKANPLDEQYDLINCGVDIAIQKEEILLDTL